MSDKKASFKNENTPKVNKVRAWSKGQFTIPASIRTRLGIKENTILEVFQVGNAIIATPKKSKVNELASYVQENAEVNNTSLNELLAELREGNHEYETD